MQQRQLFQFDEPFLLSNHGLSPLYGDSGTIITHTREKTVELTAEDGYTFLDPSP